MRDIIENVVVTKSNDKKGIHIKKIMRELCMYTGVMGKDKDYMIYLMMKDGLRQQKREETINAEVKDFEEWFNEL